MPAELRIACDVCHGAKPPEAAGWQQLLIGVITGVGAMWDVLIDRHKSVYLCSASCRANWHERQHRLARADRPTLPDLGGKS